SITVILGYKDDERVGHSIFENIHPDDLPRLKKSFKQLLKNPNKVINEITRYRHKKGQWRWMEGYAKNLLGDPSVQSIVLNYRDITDYRNAEEKLSENKRRLSILIDNLPGVVYRCLNDHDWTMEYLSSGITDLSGFKPEDFGSKWSGYNDIIHPDDRNKVWECVQAAIEKHEHFQLEYRIKTKTGETKWVWEQGAGIIDEEGNVCALEGFITDITERKLSRENERMLASVIRQTDDAVVITDSEGTIEYVNPAFEKMTGYSSHETLGKKPDLIKSGKHDDAFYKKLWKTILKGEQFNAVFSNIRKNGELFYEQETITPLMDDEGGITHFVSTGKDITSLIRAEEELRESERFSRATLDGLSAHIVIIDETGTILHVNKAWRKFAEENATETNCVCEGANYISACNIDSEGAGKKFASGIKSVLEGKRDEFQLEYTCHSSSEKRWFEGRVTLFPGDGVKKAIIAHENITERKLSEEALRCEIDFSSAVLNSLPGILYCFNDDLKVLRWNKNFEKVSGYTSEEVSRLNPLDLFEGKDRELVADRIHEVFEKGASDVEVELTTKKGERIPYYFTGVSTEIEGMPCQLGVGLDLTERKIAEEKIRKSNLLLENAQRIAHMGSWDMDVKNNYLTWSEETYCIFGITPDDFDNSFEMFYSLIHPDDREKMDRAQEIAMTDQSPLEVEYRIIRPDGQVRTLYERGEIIYNSGEMIRKTGVVLDITERKRNEDALIASEAQLSNALQIARAGHWEYDVDSDEFKFNDHFYSIFHTTVDKAGGYTMSSAEFAEKYVHPEDMDVVKTEIHRAIETTDPGYTSELEHRVIFPDGKIGYVAVRIFIIKNEKGRTIKTYGINQDITERKRSEEALSISKANLTRAQRIAKLGSWELDFGTGDLFWSDEVYNIFGISPDDFAGTYQYFFSMVHPEDKGRLQEAQDQALAGENKLDIELRIECPDGTLRWVHKLGELILDKHGKPVQLAGTVMDITDRKTAEEELQANEAQLRQLQRMESIGQLTGGVAHDFNNLLTVILGNAEILNEKLASEPQLQSMAGMMVSAARRGAELTHRLL
ncbi:MAG TPA: PAS domain-containing protein, partial [Bacteroidales bacterium]|nr:PAS domain-containing protein [Bacteroidales bacterium]